jgi:hypothetical protein
MDSNVSDKGMVVTLLGVVAVMFVLHWTIRKLAEKTEEV